MGAAESGRPTMMFLTKEAVRLAVPGVGVGAATDFISGAEPGGTVQLWEWIGDGATMFSY